MTWQSVGVISPGEMGTAVATVLHTHGGSLGFPVAIKLLKYGKKLFFPFLPIVQISDSDPHHVNMLERQTYSTSSSSHIL
jgi:hypothetical protein